MRGGAHRSGTPGPVPQPEHIPTAHPSPWASLIPYKTSKRKGDGARYFAWSQPDPRTPRASCGSSTSSRGSSQHITLMHPASGILPRALPTPCACPALDKSPEEQEQQERHCSSVARRMPRTGLRCHCAPNSPARSDFPCHRQANLTLSPLPCQRNPPASPGQAHRALISPTSPPLPSFQMFPLHPRTSALHTRCQRSPDSGQSL